MSKVAHQKLLPPVTVLCDCADDDDSDELMASFAVVSSLGMNGQD